MIERLPSQHVAHAGAAMPSQTQSRPEPLSVRIIIGLNRAIYRFARHWLLGVNAFLFAWAALIVLAPLCAATGRDGLARPIYAFFGLFCHQQPDRSFHLWDHQLAACQRCTAIYASLFVCGLIFVALRQRLRRPSWRLVGLLALPLAVDGLTQLAGLRESTPALRVLTGTLIAIAISALLFPYLESGFADMRAQIERRFARLVAAGRTRPL